MEKKHLNIKHMIHCKTNSLALDGKYEYKLDRWIDR